jgi:hypothetical protein
MKNTFLISFGILFILSCTTTLLENAQSIQLVSLKQKEDLNCTSVGLVYGGSGTGWDSGDDLRNATNEMLNNASLKGANAVHLIESGTNDFAAAVSGEALKCNVFSR